MIQARVKFTDTKGRPQQTRVMPVDEAKSTAFFYRCMSIDNIEVVPVRPTKENIS